MYDRMIQNLINSGTVEKDSYRNTLTVFKTDDQTNDFIFKLAVFVHKFLCVKMSQFVLVRYYLVPQRDRWRMGEETRGS